MKIGLLIISTNKYTDFLKPLIESADKYFLPNYDVTYFLFTNISNKELKIKTKRNTEIINVEHRDWPWMTLGRYQIFTDNSDVLSEMDYLYYTDSDMLFVDTISDEIFSDLVATQHPGYYGRRGTPETRPESLAFVSHKEKMQYFAGGFNGGASKEFIKMSKKLSENINKDYNNGIIAKWHDESHLNRYFIDNKPTKILSPSYCYADNLIIPFKKKLLALSKNHSEYRKPSNTM